MERGYESAEEAPFFEEERTPNPRPYHFGEKYDPNDSAKSYRLCPTCGGRAKRSIDAHSRLGEMHLECHRNHPWILNVKTSRIEDVNREFPFVEKGK